RRLAVAVAHLVGLPADVERVARPRRRDHLQSLPAEGVEAGQATLGVVQLTLQRLEALQERAAMRQALQCHVAPQREALESLHALATRYEGPMGHPKKRGIGPAMKGDI